MMLHSTAGYVMPTILLIEDDPTISDTLRYNFEREGYGILAAEDGVEGLELARSARPDLVILDVVLPRLDGFSLCRILREESDVPIILLLQPVCLSVETRHRACLTQQLSLSENMNKR